MSSWSRHTFVSARSPAPTGMSSASCSTRCRRGSTRTRARLAVKALEHPLGLARLGVARTDVLHLQWVGAPEIDAWLLRARAPLVFTAHDLLPRRTGHRTALWRRLFGRFQRVVVHSESGKRALTEFGVPEQKLRVIPHPVFPGEVAHRDDGQTVLALGSIRPYKGLRDAIEAVRRVDGSRLIVAGDAREQLGQYRAAGGEAVQWRLGWLTPPEIADVLAETTVAVFPYRAEIDQSGALLQALGAGVPGVVYDVGALGEVVLDLRRRPRRARGRRRCAGGSSPRAPRRSGRARRGQGGCRAGARRAHLGRGSRVPSCPLPRAPDMTARIEDYAARRRPPDRRTHQPLRIGRLALLPALRLRSLLRRPPGSARPTAAGSCNQPASSTLVTGGTDPTR